MGVTLGYGGVSQACAAYHFFTGHAAEAMRSFACVEQPHFMQRPPNWSFQNSQDWQRARRVWYSSEPATAKPDFAQSTAAVAAVASWVVRGGGDVGCGSAQFHADHLEIGQALHLLSQKGCEYLCSHTLGHCTQVSALKPTTSIGMSVSDTGQ